MADSIIVKIRKQINSAPSGGALRRVGHDLFDHVNCGRLPQSLKDEFHKACAEEYAYVPERATCKHLGNRNANRAIARRFVEAAAKLGLK